MMTIVLMWHTSPQRACEMCGNEYRGFSFFGTNNNRAVRRARARHAAQRACTVRNAQAKRATLCSASRSASERHSRITTGPSAKESTIFARPLQAMHASFCRKPARSSCKWKWEVCGPLSTGSTVLCHNCAKEFLSRLKRYGPRTFTLHIGLRGVGCGPGTPCLSDTRGQPRKIVSFSGRLPPTRTKGMDATGLRVRTPSGPRNTALTICSEDMS